MSRSLIFTALLAMLPGTALAAGYTPWGSAPAPGHVGLSPYLTVGPDGTTSLSPYAFFGAHRYLDVMVGYTLIVGPSTDTPMFTSGAIELMPRVIVHEAFLFAPRVLYVPGEAQATLALEVHGTAKAGHFAFTYNAGVRSSASADGFVPQNVFLLLAPEVKVVERIALFAEVNPTVTLPGGGGVAWSVQVVPGLTLQLDEGGSHLLSLAVPVNVAGAESTASAGFLYSGTLDLKPRSRRPATPLEP